MQGQFGTLTMVLEIDYGETWIAEGWLLDYNPEGGDQMAFWWELLWEDENFKTQVFQRYNELRSNLFSNEYINSIIDSLHSHLGGSVSRNFNRWPILGGEYTCGQTTTCLILMRRKLII